MIKIIAFDLVGVLVSEKDIKLTKTEDIIERNFGPNKSDEEFAKQIQKKLKITPKEIEEKTLNIINKIYKVNEYQLLKKLKTKFPNIKMIIATNHISLIENYIKNNLDIENIDDIIISSNINEIKPEQSFYKYILEKYQIKGEELLFLDDNEKNIKSANNLNIKTIHITKDPDIYNAIFQKIV